MPNRSTCSPAGRCSAGSRSRAASVPSRATVTYTLRAGSPRLDIGIELDWQHDEHLLSMAFPFDVRADTAACDIQFGHVRRPTHASTSWDAAKFEVCAHRYVDVSEPDFGVAVLNDGRYGHGLFDGRVRVSLARAARYPDPAADRGAHAVNLAIYPHGAGLSDVDRRGAALHDAAARRHGHGAVGARSARRRSPGAASRSTPSSSPTTTRTT